MRGRRRTGSSRLLGTNGKRAVLLFLCIAAATAGLAASAPSAGSAVNTASVSRAGSVYAWFDDDAGQLGIGIVGPQYSTLVPVATKMPAGVSSVAVASGQSHSLAVTSTGGVYAWGFNGSGQLGNGGTANQSVPVKVAVPSGVNVTAVAAGWDQSLALTSTGAVLAWGLNSHGELGNGSLKNSRVPVAVMLPAGVKVVAIAAGQYHSLAVSSTGTVYAWGDNLYGQLGDGTTGNSSVPVRVSLPAGVLATAVGAGDNHSLVVTSTGSVYAWGRNDFGQLGDGSTIQRDAPVAVRLPAGVVATKVVAGGVSPTATHPESDYSVALTAAGGVYAWGGNTHGQLGNGSKTGSGLPVLTQLPPGITAVAVGAASNWARLLASDGQIYIWGKQGFLTPTLTKLLAGLLATGISTGADGEQMLAILS